MQGLCSANTFAPTLRGIRSSRTSTENDRCQSKAIFSFPVQKQLTGSSLSSSYNQLEAGWQTWHRRGEVYSPRKLFFLCNCASASRTGRDLVKVRRLGDFPLRLQSPARGDPASPLQLVINGDQALALCFHKVLLGQQSHQLGCLKFYHQHSSNKCWPERLLLFGNSCSLSL